jgi:O-antigen ligase
MILVGILATTALFAYAGDLAEYIIDALVLRLGTATSVMQDLSVRERIAESSAAVTMIAQSPLVGHGLGAELRHFHTIDLWTKSSLFIHNGYLFLLFKVGILGTMIFLCFFLLTCLKAVQLSRTLPRGFPRAAIQGFSGVLIAMLFVTITSNVFISKESLLVIAIASAIVSAHAIVQEEERMRSSSVASPQF